MTSNLDLAEMILPWADAHHPEKAAQTRAVADRPDTFRRYLVRLVEIRWQEDATFRPTVPYDVLDETAITARLRMGQTVIEVKGAKAEGVRRWSFAELQMAASQTKSFVASLAAVKESLDMEFVSVGPKQERKLDYARRRTLPPVMPGDA